MKSWGCNNFIIKQTYFTSTVTDYTSCKNKRKVAKVGCKKKSLKILASSMPGHKVNNQMTELRLKILSSRNKNNFSPNTLRRALINIELLHRKNLNKIKYIKSNMQWVAEIGLEFLNHLFPRNLNRSRFIMILMDPTTGKTFQNQPTKSKMY